MVVTKAGMEGQIQALFPDRKNRWENSLLPLLRGNHWRDEWTEWLGMHMKFDIVQISKGEPVCTICIGVYVNMCTDMY